MQGIQGAGYVDRVMNEGISPHPVLLPMGEGTPEQGAAIATASPLPWGEGQGEGSDLFPINTAFIGAHRESRGGDTVWQR